MCVFSFKMKDIIAVKISFITFQGAVQDICT